MIDGKIIMHEGQTSRRVPVYASSIIGEHLGQCQIIYQAEATRNQPANSHLFHQNALGKGERALQFYLSITNTEKVFPLVINTNYCWLQSNYVRDRCASGDNKWLIDLHITPLPYHNKPISIRKNKSKSEIHKLPKTWVDNKSTQKLSKS